MSWASGAPIVFIWPRFWANKTAQCEHHMEIKVRTWRAGSNTIAHHCDIGTITKSVLQPPSRNRALQIRQPLYRGHPGAAATPLSLHALTSKSLSHTPTLVLVCKRMLNWLKPIVTLQLSARHRMKPETCRCRLRSVGYREARMGPL